MRAVCDATTLKQWNVYVGEALQASAISILEAGKRMAEFKNSCDSTQGGSKFSQHAEKFWGMSSNTALRWAKIGESVQLQDDTLELPSSMYTLYELATLGAKDFTRANKERLITRETTREQILDFKRRLKGPKAKPQPTPKPENDTTVEPENDNDDGAEQDDIVKAIELLSKYAMQAAHPDKKGGSDEAFIKVSEAKAMLLDMFA